MSSHHYPLSVKYYSYLLVPITVFFILFVSIQQDIYNVNDCLQSLNTNFTPTDAIVLQFQILIPLHT